MNWIVLSLTMSVVLTLVLNLAIRAFPTGRRRLEDRAARWADEPPDRGGAQVRVFFPWKAMLIGSIALTVLLNVVASIAR